MEQWIRFSKYELRDGYIAPAESAARSTYAPFDEHAKLRSETNRLNGEPTAYERLLDIAERSPFKDYHLSRKKRPPVDVSQEVIDLVLQWCSDFGLLGIMHHDCLLIRPYGTRVVGKRISTQTEYVGSGGTWDTVTTIEKTGKAVYRDAKVIVCGVNRNDNDRPAEADFTWLRQSFFPQCDSEYVQFGLPTKSGMQFLALILGCGAAFDTWAWELYAERLVDFLQHAEALRLAVQWTRDDVSVFKPWMNSILRRTSLAVNADRRVVTQFASLFAALAATAAHEIADGFRTIRCSSCGALFATRAYQAKYCKQRCQWRELKRRKKVRDDECKSDSR